MPKIATLENAKIVWNAFITNFGRTIEYLACVYQQSEDEETVQRNVQRCVEELRTFDIPKLKQSNQRPILITLSLALMATYAKSVILSLFILRQPSK